MNNLDPIHYKRYEIQPRDFITANKLNFNEGNIVKYVCRYPYKNGLEDLKKARNYVDYMLGKHDPDIEYLYPCEPEAITAQAFADSNRLNDLQAYIIYFICEYHKYADISDLHGASRYINYLINNYDKDSEDNSKDLDNKE